MAAVHEIIDKGVSHRIASYSVNLTSSVMVSALGGGSEVFQMRWTDARNLCHPKQITVWAGGITAFTAGALFFELFVARGWTSDGSGGTAATLTGDNNKLRTAHNTTGMGAIRVASTAALTAGTKTLDSQGLISVGGSTTATAGTPLLAPTPLIQPYAFFYPLLLAKNEGLVIKATVPAAGTWTFGVSVAWDELRDFVD